MSNYKLYEEINPALRAVAEKFDLYCASNNIEYTVESDEHDEQGFHVRMYEVAPIKSHMDEVCADHKIYMRVDEDKFGTLFLFRLEPLQEVDNPNGTNLPEDQYKFPSRRNIRAQSAFRSSFGKSRTFGGRGAKTESFEDALQQKLDEGVLGMQSMPVLFIVQQGVTGKSTTQSSTINGDLVQKAKEMLQLINNDSEEHFEIASLLHTIINKLSGEESTSIDDIIDSEIP